MSLLLTESLLQKILFGVLPVAGFQTAFLTIPPPPSQEPFFLFYDSPRGFSFFLLTRPGIPNADVLFHGNGAFC